MTFSKPGRKDEMILIKKRSGQGKKTFQGEKIHFEVNVNEWNESEVLTPCEYVRGVNAGSYACTLCMYYEMRDQEENFVICKHPRK
jgi:hypothetical protein